MEECQTAATATFLVDLSIQSSAVQLPGDHVRQGAEQSSVARRKEEIVERWNDIKKFMTISAHYRHQIQPVPAEPN